MSMSSRFIECPSCGALQEDFDDKRIVNNFCSECDYPIFFDTFDESQRDSEDASARNRSPGVEGRSKQNWRECPACGEKNDRDALHCVRCGAVLLIPDDEEVAPENQEPEPYL